MISCHDVSCPIALLLVGKSGVNQCPALLRSCQQSSSSISDMFPPLPPPPKHPQIRWQKGSAKNWTRTYCSQKRSKDQRPNTAHATIHIMLPNPGILGTPAKPR